MKKIIVTGNSGKTVLSYFLAEKLSKKAKVILISTDTSKGVYNCIFPKLKKNKKSLGHLLADPVITIDDLYANSHLITDNFLMLSYGENEKLSDFPEVTSVNLTKLFVAINSLADVLIVDSSNHAFDDFIKSSENCLNICSTSMDMRGYHYRYRKGVGDINVLFQNSPYASSQDIIGTFSDKPFELPYVKTFLSIYTGVNINEIQLPKMYSKILEKIIKEVNNE